MDQLKFIIPGKPEYLTTVRLAISSLAVEAGFDFDEVEDLKTAVSEACKNVSCHGFAGFSDKYEIIVNIEPKRMEITVKDDCDEHTLKKTHFPCRKCPQEGDLGVFVIESLVDEVEFTRSEENRKIVRLVKVAE